MRTNHVLEMVILFCVTAAAWNAAIHLETAAPIHTPTMEQKQ